MIPTAWAHRSLGRIPTTIIAELECLSVGVRIDGKRKKPKEELGIPV